MSSLKSVAVLNPTTQPFTHMWDSEEYTIPAGEYELFPEGIAQNVASHLAKSILRSKGRFLDKKVGEEFRSQAVSAKDINSIVDKLILSKEDLKKNESILNKVAKELGLENVSEQGEEESSSGSVGDDEECNEADVDVESLSYADLKKAASAAGFGKTVGAKKDDLIAFLKENA